MHTQAAIVRGKYLDSVKLMLISRQMRETEGITDAVAILATHENRSILAATDMLAPEVESALETDIVIVVKADDPDKALAAIQAAEELINKPANGSSGGTDSLVPRSIGAAVNSGAPADLCLISVAGKYAAAEADNALDAGLHVMLFSDNVSLEDELRLKQKAISKGLLMMGPDCGTAIVNGVPLGFANSVPLGNIGIVSASGTGLQEVSCGIANRGFGISQAFGTGGRDGKAQIGGLMLAACFDFLTQDPTTEVIVLIAKTPDPEVREALWKRVASTSKPVIVNFLRPIEQPSLPNLHYCTSLDETAALACHAASQKHIPDSEEHPYPPLILNAPKRYIRGLYSGGTLCGEACEIYTRVMGAAPKSNVSSDPAFRLSDPWKSEGDCFIDMGADEFTVGRPHPMIDFSLRLKKLAQEAADPTVAVILLDVVLGWGAHPDPASELVPVLKTLPPELCIVCHVLGTDGDPQNAIQQAQQLRDAGARVFRSHHAAASYAIGLLADNRRTK
jgi:FdrA protein